MRSDIFILGKGFIGSRLGEALSIPVLAEKIYSFEDAQKVIEKYTPKVLINCIGFTGRNVDECEKNIEKTLTSNTFVPIILAEVCLRHKIKLVHISSGCIYHYDYEKDGPIKEEKIPDFFDLFYSRTKIYSERVLKVLAEKFNFLILRIRIPLDNRPHPKNLLTKLINYKRVIDIPNSVTYIPDFIKAFDHLLKINAKGIFNVVNKGGLRYPDLLEVYKKYVPGFQYEVISLEELNLVRTNLILSTEKLEKTGFKVRDINEVLEECVKEYVKG